jgi:2-C-methyl-D-erythritol 2,4-cyclodiphosphate synthase
MMRVGIGYDIHRLVPGRELWLGGVHIEHASGLLGHSDADVLLHAIMDALLGAAGLRDIGHYFPPADGRWRGASSLALLESVTDLVRDAGYSTVNVDAVLIAEEPHIGPHVDRMRHLIADALQISVSAVGVKATTNEGVGPEGRKEAISAQAVALLEGLDE